MTITETGSVFFKLVAERGRYRDRAGETIGADDATVRDTLRAVLSRSCVEAEEDVEVRGRLYRTMVYVLVDEPEECYLEADRDGVPISARATKVSWRDQAALPYLRRHATLWERTESLTHEPGLPLASAFVPPRLRLAPREQTGQKSDMWLHWEDLATHSRVVLVGEPGSGKTTCLRRLVYEANLRSARQIDTLPMYLQLRDFAAASLDVEYLRSVLMRESGAEMPDEFARPLYGGRVLLLLDGLDEIVDHHERAKFLENLRALCAEAPSIRIILTTREYCYDGELADFTHLRIEPFSLDRIARWYHLRTGVVATEVGQPTALAALLRDDGFRDLLGNPLMLAVVATAGARNWVTDGEKAGLLRRCVEMLTENWDAARGVIRLTAHGVTPRQVETSLADLSWTLILQDRTEFTISDFQQLIDRNVGIHDSPVVLLNACHASGLITSRDRTRYQFTHQALRDYLAASRVAHHVSSAEPLLQDCMRNPSAQNVWSLSCATATDASDLLHRALTLEGPRDLERAAILAGALSQQISAPRRLVEKCSDYIATQLEQELAHARVDPQDAHAHEVVGAQERNDAGDSTAWRAWLSMPAHGRDEAIDRLLEQLFVAVYNTRSGSCSEVVRSRLEKSRAPGVRHLADMLAVQGECTARVLRRGNSLMASFVVVDAARLLAAEVSPAEFPPDDLVADDIRRRVSGTSVDNRGDKTDSLENIARVRSPLEDHSAGDRQARAIQGSGPVDTPKRGATELLLSVRGDDSADALEDLSGWLRQEPELRGRVRLTDAAPKLDGLEALQHSLIAVVGSGGVMGVLAASLMAFLALRRTANLRIVVATPGGRSVELDAMQAGDVEAMLARVLDTTGDGRPNS